MGFVEVAKEFRADVPEHGISLHDNHHSQVAFASIYFEDKLQEEMASTQVVDTTQGPNEKRALAYLDGFLSFPFVSEPEKLKIQAAKSAIKLAKFQKLQREVNALKRNAKKAKIKPVELLDAVIKIIDKYPINIDNSETSTPLLPVKSFEKNEARNYHLRILFIQPIIMEKEITEAFKPTLFAKKIGRNCTICIS